MENNYTIRQQNADQQTAELIARFKGNDTKAFNELYHMHVNMLFNYGSRLTQDAELLKDCIQDVFIRIYHRRSEIENIQNLKSYLLISLKNKLCDESRRRVHLSDVAVEELSVMACEHVEKDYITRESANNLKQKVSKLLDKLSPRQRDAIELYYIQERKYEDICEIMQMNYQSVRNLIHRGMLRMRACAV